ncbi:MAG TPA: hypothetical protein VFP40_06930, partial [Terriglobales bacterium]|nr:hypothetical protein [Terriglobales bacterium]
MGTWPVDAAKLFPTTCVLPSGNDGWWNLTSSHLPDLKLVLESQKDLKGGLLRVDSTVEEALEQLRTVLPKFIL